MNHNRFRDTLAYAEKKVLPKFKKVSRQIDKYVFHLKTTQNGLSTQTYKYKKKITPLKVKECV